MFNTPQNQAILLERNIDEVYNAILQAIPTVRGFKLKHADAVNHYILANVGMSAFSWGEEMTVQLFVTPDGKTQVTFSSASKLGTEIAAGSKNRENVQKLQSAMAAFLR